MILHTRKTSLLLVGGFAIIAVFALIGVVFLQKEQTMSQVEETLPESPSTISDLPPRPPPWSRRQEEYVLL